MRTVLSSLEWSLFPAAFPRNRLHCFGGLRADRQIKIRQFLFSRNNVTYRNAKTAKLKIRQFRFSTIFAQSTKYNSRQYFQLYGIIIVISYD